MNYIRINEFVGKTFTKIIVNERKTIIFFKTETEKFEMLHLQDCCENVEIDDINGDLSDLLNTPILIAEKTTNSDETFGRNNHDESFTWTFYKLATMKGYVTIRWYGESNGYYSEEVDIIKVND